MQRAACWIVLGLVLALVPAVASAGPQTAPVADPGLLPGSSCEASSSSPYLFFVDGVELNPANNARHATNWCCVSTGCCTFIESGCEACPQGGRRWYDKYSCPGGQTCKMVPNSCPTAC